MDWTMQGGSPSSSYRVDEEVRFPLKLAWKSETGMKAPPMSETLIVGNRVLVKTWKVVSGLDLATGERLWQVACLPIQITAENFIKTAMAAWGERVFFSDWYGNLYCVDSQDGRLLWIKAGLGAREHALCVTEDRVICTPDATDTLDFRLGFHVLDFEGRVIWTKNDVLINTDGIRVYKDWLVYGQRPGLLKVTRLSDGREEDQLDIRAPRILADPRAQLADPRARIANPDQAYFTGTPTIVGDTLLVNVGNFFRILVFDLRQSRIKWWYYNWGGIAGWGMNHDTVYGPENGGDFCKFDLQTGEEILRKANPPQYDFSRTVDRGTTVGNYAFFTYDRDGTIVAFDLRTGESVWTYRPPKGYQNAVSFSQGNLVFCDSRGKVHCFRSAG